MESWKNTMILHDVTSQSQESDDAYVDGGTSPPVNPCGIPLDLRERDQWVHWQYRYNAEAAKWDKPPCASVGTFAARYNYLTRIREHDGLGFQLAPDDGLVCIDLDHCIHDGLLDTWASRIVEDFDTFTDTSPSGTGIHLWTYASIPTSRKNHARHIEMTSGRGYITCTGVMYHDAPIRACERAATALYTDTFPLTPVSGPSQGIVASTGHLYSDDALLDIARNQRDMSKALRFRALYDEGEWEGSYPSQSEADSALAYDLAWFIGPDAARVERLFGMSALGQRDKWIQREDYRTRTIARALQGRTKFYNATTPHSAMGSKDEHQ